LKKHRVVIISNRNFIKINKKSGKEKKIRYIIIISTTQSSGYILYGMILKL